MSIKDKSRNVTMKRQQQRKCDRLTDVILITPMRRNNAIMDHLLILTAANPRDVVVHPTIQFNSEIYHRAKNEYGGQ
jgi:hypothetical protein